MTILKLVNLLNVTSTCGSDGLLKTFGMTGHFGLLSFSLSHDKWRYTSLYHIKRHHYTRNFTVQLIYNEIRNIPYCSSPVIIA